MQRALVMGARNRTAEQNLSHAARPVFCLPVFAAQFHNLMCEHTFDIEFRRIIGAGCADAARKRPQHGWGATEAVQESYPPHDRSGPCHFRPIKWLLALA